MAYDDPQLVHYDQILTNISVGYANLNFVGEQLFPTVRVGKQSDKYYVFPRDRFQTMDDIRTPKSRANEIPPTTLSLESYFAQEHALVGMVAREDVENADAGINPMAEETERVTDILLLNRENSIQAMVRATANYAPGHTVTLSGTAQWNDYVNSTPIADMKAGRDVIHGAIFRTPNVALMGYEVMAALEDHPTFLDRIKSGLAQTSEGVISDLLGVPTIIRGNAVRSTAALGQTVGVGDTEYLWGKDVVLAFVPPTPGRRTPAFGYEFNWPYRGGPVMPTERWWDDDHKAWKVNPMRRYDLRLIAIDDPATSRSIAGYLIKNAVL